MQTLKTDTRKRILQVSKKLFLKKGFRATTRRDIAREAGINLSNLYHYFASKDELFRQLLKPATDTLEAMLNEHHGIKGEDILSMQEEGYVEATLEEYIDAIRKYRNLCIGKFLAVTGNLNALVGTLESQRLIDADLIDRKSAVNGNVKMCVIFS